MTAASKPLSLDNISQEKILHLKKYPRLLDALDQWVMFADRRLIPEMRELGHVVQKLYDLPDVLHLYRGFRLGSFQDSLGISEDAHIGQVTHYKTDERSLSFSTDEEIAKAFGNVVVSTDVRSNNAEYLYITDELVVIIHELRKLEQIKTQCEVILLPPMELALKVVQFEKSKAGWLGW
jgi:hypothetical protein